MELEALTSGYKVFNFRQCGMVGLKFDFKWFFWFKPWFKQRKPLVQV